ncbi:CPBP family intramembrane glutamic endopeptidase [Gloeobacter kilaueensis]|uniref:Metal-dependent membrane protease n=1 Tax=Gloeobacter kilaueensis (strain ATCC BAA-2537 / CCAP 1431/1 / ULC 316 / JS1) TaxID=1183438 RepID=U5QQ75_GLOK1|nr:type II CAAX endopeptidase family protein [Gloeobacter kilaueensis]AGY59805.1 metal-dependent membrane protease [Gloeobacter kilaueensis JS1]
MTSDVFRRALLIATTALVLLLGVTRFIQTIKEPQPRAQLALDSTDLQLQLLTLKADPDLKQTLEGIDSKQLLQESVQAYEQARLDPATQPDRLLKLGLLQAAQNKPAEARATWSRIAARSPLRLTAEVLSQLWQMPPILAADAQSVLAGRLEGWYRSAALSRLYKLQQRTDALRELEVRSRTEARGTLIKLGLLNVVPLVGLLAGLIVLALWVFWRTRQADPPDWQVPWGPGTLWEVVIYWFAAFFSSGLLAASFIGGERLEQAGPLAQALFTLFAYGLIAGSGLALLALLVWQPYPNSRKLFNYSLVPGWWRWGVGGWLAAVPLVFVTSLLAQRLFGEGGGGNSLLSGIEGSASWLVQLLLLVSIAVAAPLFEETFFRGFVFPSLASRLGAPAAIVASAALFGIAHFSAVEFFPLFALGVVLGTLYHHTRSLAPCILLHALWNSSTFLVLLLLGS